MAAGPRSPAAFESNFKGRDLRQCQQCFDFTGPQPAASQPAPGVLDARALLDRRKRCWWWPETDRGRSCRRGRRTCSDIAPGCQAAALHMGRDVGAAYSPALAGVVIATKPAPASPRSSSKTVSSCSSRLVQVRKTEVGCQERQRHRHNKRTQRISPPAPAKDRNASRRGHIEV
jgi:hypothetical protein